MQFIKNSKMRYVLMTLLFITVCALSFIFVGNLKTDAAWTESAYLKWAGYTQNASSQWVYKKSCGELGGTSGCNGSVVVQSWTTKNLTCTGTSKLSLKCAVCNKTFNHSLTNTHSRYDTQVGGYIHKKCHYCNIDETIRPIEYTIEFVKNDGDGDNVTASGTMTSVTHKYAETMSLPENKFTRRFYSFGGWMTSASGSVVFQDKADITNWLTANGTTITDGSTVKLYAKWVGKATFAVALWGGTMNGQTGTIEYTGVYGETVQIYKPTKSGYRFVRWNASGIEGTLSSTSGDATYTFPKGNGFDNIEAVWEIQEYRISYNGNNASSGSVASQLLNIEVGSQKIQGNSFARPGYTFKSWNTKADGSGTTYNPGDTYSTLANLTLYAQWEKNKSTLVVNPNGGTWGSSAASQSFTQEYGSTKSIPIPTRTGYDFVRWVDVPLNGSITSWTAASTYTFGTVAGATDTLTATWKEKTYTVSYDANGGTGSVGSQQKPYTSDILLQDNSFTKYGKVFLKWNTKADGTGTSYNEGATYSRNENVTLYAIWVDSSYTNVNGVEYHAFDTDVDLPNVKVTNVTLTYDTPNNVEVDFASNTTDVAFAGWTMYDSYDDAAYAYSDYNTNHSITGNYYAEKSQTDSLVNLKSFIGCGQCNSLLFHGSLRNIAGDTLRRHFDYDHDGSNSPTDCGLSKVYSGKWANNTAENKGENRNSLAVAEFNGSWSLVLPNAYRTGYVFTGWYVEVNSGTYGSEQIPIIDEFRGTSNKYYKYMGMAGDTYDLSNLVREHNTNTTSATDSPTGLKNITVGVNNNLSGIKLFPRFEPIHYKILYVMNIPASDDPSTAHNGLQSHTLLENPASLTDMHSVKYDTTVKSYDMGYGNVYYDDAVPAQSGNGYKLDSNGKQTIIVQDSTASVGTTNPNHKNYSYIGEKTYIYDGSDWILEDIPITVNDYYFTGWTYDDIVWTGYGGMKANGVVLGQTRIGNGILDTHDKNNDYSLITLSMQSNVVQNIKNNLPDTRNTHMGTTKESGKYTSYYTVPTTRTFAGLPNPQSDGTNASAKPEQLSELNIDNPTVYIVLKANWTDETVFEDDVLYDSNNDAEKIYTQYDAFDKFTDYIGILNNQKDQEVLGDAAFGKAYGSYIVDSKDTAVGDTSNDGSYDYNATSDRFVVKANSDKYYSGVSNGRNGFFSFQGWSAWKYATWRDAIDSNKKDTDTSELQFVGAASGKPLGHDGYSIDSSFTSGALTMRRYNDVTRQKRVGDLFYRMAAVLYPKSEYNSAFADTNRNGQMLNANGTGENYKPTLSETYWDTYQWRWAQGTTGHYAIPVKGVLDEGIHLYAIWDAYPTSHIENTYVYLSDIATLTPDYLFSKVTVYDFEDFWNQKNYAIGETYGNDGVDWGEVAYKDSGKNYDSHNAGSYTYTYNIKGDEAYMKGKFTATLVDYDYSRFQNATFVDDIASVSMTFKFVDSAGNTTYKTAWIYIIDEDDTEREQEADANDPDNTRYSLTRFISKEFYEKAEFDVNGNYIIGSADESAGSLLVRSKWYLNNSYKDQLLSAFDRLENVGDSNMRIDANILDLWGGKARYVNEDGSEHQYHPQLLFDETTGGLKWYYPWDNLKTQTEGVYVLDYDDILKTKQFILEKNLDTGNYSGDTLSEYINEIFDNTAAKDSNGNTLRIND